MADATAVRPTKKAAKGSGTTISIELKDHPELLASIRNAAKADDREVSKFLRRRLVQLHGDGKLLGGNQ